MAAQAQAGSSSSFFSNLFGQRAAEQQEAPPSVLAAWNSYAAESTGPSRSDEVWNQMEAGQKYVSSSLTRITSGVSGAANTQLSSIQLPSSTQLKYSAALAGSGLFFLVLAFSLFLPVVILAPSKFALTFTLGSILLLAAFVTLRGWQSQLAHLFSSDRLLFTAAYLGSMGGTLYASLVMHSYVLSLLCCAAQVVALAYFALSYFPGGIYGLKYIGYTFQTMFFQLFSSCFGR